jgi:hypothetical protein
VVTRARLNPADLVVHVQPRAAATEVVGPHGDAIKVLLAAPPVDGAANEELVRFLAERLGARRSEVSIVRGLSGRRKTVRIAGLTGDVARERLLARSK